MVSARRVALKGLTNTRDLGGFVTEDGKLTKYNVFFRSESLFGLDTDAVMDFKKYGINNCIDIHGQIDDVLRIHPFQNNPCFDYYCIPVLSDVIKHKGTHKDNFQEADWIGVNTRMLEVNKEWVKQVIDMCACVQTGTIIHCRTGKSRTSLICMLIMLLAKVPNVDIVAEFATTEIYMKEKYDMYLKNSFHSEGFYKSPAFVMEETIKYIYDNYSGVELYLKSCGVSEESMKKIIEKYVCNVTI